MTGDPLTNVALDPTTLHLTLSSGRGNDDLPAVRKVAALFRTACAVAPNVDALGGLGAVEVGSSRLRKPGEAGGVAYRIIRSSELNTKSPRCDTAAVIGSGSQANVYDGSNDVGAIFGTGSDASAFGGNNDLAAVFGDGLTASAMGSGVTTIEPSFLDVPFLDGIMLP
jgi:hypothetical protein